MLHDISFTLERARPMRSWGPTGGGKTTTASLMARLYDPTKGTVYLAGRDIRSYAPSRALEENRLHPSGAVPLLGHGARQYPLRQRRIRESHQ